MIAFVAGVQAASTIDTSRLNVAGSMSTNTGRAPSRAIDPAVAKNEYGEVTTSSPGPIFSAISAASNASVPDDTPMACRTRSIAASSRSSASTSGPMMKRCESQTRVMAASTSSRMPAYCAFRSSSGTFLVRGPSPASSACGAPSPCAAPLMPV